MVNFRGACHKRFRTLAQAEAFIADWVEMDAYVKAKIKKELSDGHRPAKMKGLPVELTLKTGASNDGEDELTDDLGRLKVE